MLTTTRAATERRSATALSPRSRGTEAALVCVYLGLTAAMLLGFRATQWVGLAEQTQLWLGERSHERRALVTETSTSRPQSMSTGAVFPKALVLISSQP